MQCVWSPLNEMSITPRTNNSFFFFKKKVQLNEDDITAFSLLQTDNNYLHGVNKRYICTCSVAALLSSLLRVVQCQYFFLPFPNHPPALNLWFDVLHKWLVCCNWIGCKKIINWYFTPGEVKLPYLEWLLWK